MSKSTRHHEVGFFKIMPNYLSLSQDPKREGKKMHHESFKRSAEKYENKYVTQAAVALAKQGPPPTQRMG